MAQRCTEWRSVEQHLVCDRWRNLNAVLSCIRPSSTAVYRTMLLNAALVSVKESTTRSATLLRSVVLLLSYGKATQPSATQREASSKQRRSALLRTVVTPCLAGGL